MGIDDSQKVWWIRRTSCWSYDSKTSVEDYLIQNPSGQIRPIFLEPDAPEPDDGLYEIKAAKSLVEHIAATHENFYHIPPRTIKLICPHAPRGNPELGRLSDLKQDHLARHAWTLLIYINPVNDQAMYYCNACKLLTGKHEQHPLPAWARKKLEAIGYLPHRERAYKDRKHNVWDVLDLIRQVPRITYHEIDMRLGMPNGTAKRLCIWLKKHGHIKIKGAKKNQLEAV